MRDIQESVETSQEKILSRMEMEASSGEVRGHNRALYMGVTLLTDLKG
jgi:hypothetical protein